MDTRLKELIFTFSSRGLGGKETELHIIFDGVMFFSLFYICIVGNGLHETLDEGEGILKNTTIYNAPMTKQVLSLEGKLQ